MHTFTSTLEAAPHPLEKSTYLERLRHLCQDAAALDALERRLKSGARALARDRRADLRPTWRRAAVCQARSLVHVTLALSGTVLALRLGAWPLVVPGIYVAGLGMYGLFSVCHDTVHGSFTPSRRVNTILGWLSAAVLLLDFEEFRHSHMLHHRHSQSGRDPKRLGIPDVYEGEDRPLLFGPVERYPLFLRLWATVGDRILNQPRWLRLSFYLLSWFVIAPLFIIFAAAEFSFARRRWSKPGSWAMLASTVAVYAAIAALSPASAALLLASAVASYAFTFLVFLTHLGPDQLYSQSPVFSPALASLNVSDLYLGPITHWSGHGFSENHAAHHLLPHVPSYALREVTAWMERGFGLVKAPAIRFDGDSIVAIGDAMIAVGTRPQGEGWLQWKTPRGALLQRCANLPMHETMRSGRSAGSQTSSLRSSP